MGRMNELTKGHGEKKSRKEQAAIIALLNEPTIKKAALKVGIGEATLWRWMQEADFKEQFRLAKKQSLSQAISKLQQSTGIAAETLLEICVDIAAPPASRVAASKTIIEMGFKAVEIEELESRIAQLEKTTEQPKGLRGVR